MQLCPWLLGPEVVYNLSCSLHLGCMQDVFVTRRVGRKIPLIVTRSADNELQGLYIDSIMKPNTRLGLLEFASTFSQCLNCELSLEEFPSLVISPV